MAESALSTSTAIAILSLFAVLSFVALVIDRRALLVSSLLYLGYANSQILTWSGIGSESLGFLGPDRRRHRAGAVGRLAAPAPHCSQHSSRGDPRSRAACGKTYLKVS